MTNPGIVTLEEPAFTPDVVFDKDLVLAWVDALESGTYRQTRGYLKQDIRDPETDDAVTGYCCLGVLIELAQARGYPVWWEEDSEDNYHAAKWREVLPTSGKTRVGASTHKLPADLATAVGLASGLGEKSADAIQAGDSLIQGKFWAMPSPFDHDQGREMSFASLAGANDDGVNFPEIAKAIRRAILQQEQVATG